MSKKRELERCKKPAEFIDYAVDHGAWTRSGRGSHVIVCTAEGACPIPTHKGELGVGLCHKIVKIFSMIGLATILWLIFNNPDWVAWFVQNL